MRQAYDYWQNQPDCYSLINNRPSLHPAGPAHKPHQLNRLACVAFVGFRVITSQQNGMPHSAWHLLSTSIALSRGCPRRCHTSIVDRSLFPRGEAGVVQRTNSEKIITSNLAACALRPAAFKALFQSSLTNPPWMRSLSPQV